MELEWICLIWLGWTRIARNKWTLEAEAAVLITSRCIPDTRAPRSAWPFTYPQEKGSIRKRAKHSQHFENMQSLSWNKTRGESFYHLELSWNPRRPTCTVHLPLVEYIPRPRHCMLTGSMGFVLAIVGWWKKAIGFTSCAIRKMPTFPWHTVIIHNMHTYIELQESNGFKVRREGNPASVHAAHHK
jgi:hypothetical protein